MHIRTQASTNCTDPFDDRLYTQGRIEINAFVWFMVQEISIHVGERFMLYLAAELSLVWRYQEFGSYLGVHVLVMEF